MCANVLTSDRSPGSRNGKRSRKVSKSRKPLRQRKLLVEQLESRWLLAFTANGLDQLTLDHDAVLLPPQLLDGSLGPYAPYFTPAAPFGEPDEHGLIFAGYGPSPDEPVLTTFNRNAADTTNADQLWSDGGLGLDLSGAGYTVGVWDGGHIRDTHQEFRVGTGPSRVTIKDSPTSYSNHGTHVGGTIGAEGDVPEARGMANQVKLWSYDWNNDTTEMAAAAGSIVASNHSYGYVRGWTPINVEGTWYGQWVDDRCLGNQDRFFGKYDSNTRTLDSTLFNNPDLLSVWAAGNDRGDSWAWLNSQYVAHLGSSCAPGEAGWYLLSTNHPTWPAPGADGSHKGGFDVLSQQQTAKNSLVVGAIHDITVDPYGKSDVVMTSFSAWGPTDDGRIKPDVVGNGYEVDSTGASTDGTYYTTSGTSMAAPNVTGTATLVIEHYNNTFNRPVGSSVRSATTKAILIHTAFDAGNTGPDYVFGWGVVDAAAAANLITDTQAANPWSAIQENTYTGTTWTQDVRSNGDGPLQVTVAWTDPAPTTLPAVGLDDATKVLVNDLDLWITGPGGTYYPWTLNPANPSAPAVRTQRNDRDNVEQVLIDEPAAGIYTIHVGHSGNSFAQDYSLVMSGASEDTTPPWVEAVVASDVLRVDLGQETYEFTIEFRDNVAIDVSTLDDNDVTVTGPNGFSQGAVFVSVAPTGNGTPRTATYQITPPGGSWSAEDAGRYTIMLNADQVFDTAGNPVAADASLTRFTVTPLIDVQLVALVAPSASDAVQTLPNSITEIVAGNPFYLEIWVQDIGRDAGVVGGYVTLTDTKQATVPIDLVHYDLYNGFGMNSGEIIQENGQWRVEDFGGATMEEQPDKSYHGLGKAPDWVRMGYVEYLATGSGTLEVVASPGSIEFALTVLDPNNVHNIPWEDVALGSVSVEFVPQLTSELDEVTGTLTISDVNVTGRPNEMTVRIDEVGNLLISDENEQFDSAPTGGELIDDGRTLRIPLASVTGALVINLGNGDDVLTVDFSGGNPIPAGGLDYHGGGGDDLLRIVGSGSEAVVYTPDSTTYGNGEVVVDGGTIQFTGLEPTDYDNVGTFTLSLPNAGAAVEITAGTLGGNGDAALVFTGTSGGVAFESAHVRNTANVTLDTRAVAGTDTITINSADNAHGNTNLTILTGSEAGDVIQVTGPMVFAGSVSLSSTNVSSIAAGTIQTGTGLTVTNTGTASTLAGAISGDGGLAKDGPGTLVLNSEHTFAGGMTLGAGTLEIGHNNALGTGTFTLAGGTIQATTGPKTLSNPVLIEGDFTAGATDSIHLNGTIGLQAGTRTVNVALDRMILVFNGLVSNGGLVKEGSGLLSLANGDNTFAEGVSLNAGVLTLNASSTPTSGAPTKGPLGSGTLAINGGEISGVGSTRSLANPVTVGGDFSITGQQTLVLNGDVDLVGLGRVVAVWANKPAIFGGVVSNGGLTKAGTGTLALEGTNTYSGATTIDGGTLSVDGSITSDTTVSNAGTVLNGSGTVTGTVGVNSGATLAGTLTISGAVTVNGGNVTPGTSVGTLQTGDLDLQAGAHFTADITGATTYDQIQVTGTVTLDATESTGSLLTINSTLTSLPENTVITLIANDGSDGITGAFRNYAEGATVMVGTVATVISYQGGAGGNNVTLTVPGDFEIDSAVFGANASLRLVKNGSNVDLIQVGTPDVVLDSRPLSTVNSYTVSAASGTSNDSLILDFSAGYFTFNGGITFDGGTGGDDSLIILGGGPFTKVEYTYDSPPTTPDYSGNVQLTKDGYSDHTIVFRNLTPLVGPDQVDDVVLNLPDAYNNAILENLGGPGDGWIRFRSQEATPTFEQTDFQVPNKTLTINMASATNDALTIATLDSTFRAAITVTSGSGVADAVTLDGHLTLGSATSTGDLSIAAETINLNANINTDGNTAGGVGGSVSLTGAVVLGAASVTIGTSAATTDGNVTITGTVNADGAANDRTLTIDAGLGGDVSISGAMGAGQALAGLTVTAAKDLSLTAVSLKPGASVTQTAGSGTTTLGGNIAASGTGSISITTARNIVVSLHSSITTVDGNIRMSANQQAVPYGGTFTGISVHMATISTTGTGKISLAGRGGDTYVYPHWQRGVYLSGGGKSRSNR